MKRADIHTEHINNLILSFLNRTISSTDLKVLKEWIDENEDNKAYFSEIQKIWLISSIYEKKNFDKLKDRAFQQFKDRIAQKNQEQDIYISRPNWNRIFYIAACIIIAFFAGIGVMYFTGNQRLSDQTLSYSVESPRGSKLKLSLPDGTSVWLNADSKLLYDNNFGINNRDVTLCGEGYFEVSKNKNLPFQVVSDDIKVEVLGTKFNVKNYPEDPNIKVALLEGSVMLYDSLESTILKPNQIAQYDKQNKKTTLKTIAAENTSAWINGHLYFDEENMETIALALERAFDVNIVRFLRAGAHGRYDLRSTVRRRGRKDEGPESRYVPRGRCRQGLRCQSQGAQKAQRLGRELRRDRLHQLRAHQPVHGERQGKAHLNRYFPRHVGENSG